MTSDVFRVTCGRISVACFASDATEAIERACELIAEQYGVNDLSPDTCFFKVERVSAAEVDFNDEIL